MAYQGRINPERLVFIDETWTKTNMAPLRGWAPFAAEYLAWTRPDTVATRMGSAPTSGSRQARVRSA